MDDVDAFLASLDRFTSPSIDSGIESQRTRHNTSTGSTPATAAPADASAEHSSSSGVAGPSTVRSSRRRPRQNEAQSVTPSDEQRDQQRERSGQPSFSHGAGPMNANGTSHTPGTAAAAASTTAVPRHGGAAEAWWCVRCNAENSPDMLSCALCHRRRHRVEGPRPGTAELSTHPSNTAASMPGNSGVLRQPTGSRDEERFHRGKEPLVIAGPNEVSCPRCTFLNPSSRQTCEICEGPLPSPASQAGAAAASSTPSMTNGVSVKGSIANEHNGFDGTKPPSSLTPSAAASAVVPSVALPGLSGSVGRGRAQGFSSAPSHPISSSTTSSAPFGFAASGESHLVSAAAASSLADPRRRPPALQGTTRGALSISPVAVSRGNNDTNRRTDLSGNSSDSSSSSESDEDSSSDASDHDSDWNDQQSTQHAALDHRELVRFLETLQSVRFDELPLASAPASMRTRAELRPFQLQALSWLLSREQQQTSRDEINLLDEDEEEDIGKSAHSVKEVSVDSPKDRRKPNNSSASAWSVPSSAAQALSNGSASSPTLTTTTTRDMSHTVRGGVFADYMGLGKTRTLIALCEAARAPTIDRVTGSLVESTATLIVCPTSLLSQWVAEIQRCVERPATAPLRILIYYGARKRRQTLFQVAQSYDYVLTTYQTLTHEQPPVSVSHPSTVDRSGLSIFAADPYDYAEELDEDGSGAYDVDRHLQTEVGKLFMIRWARVILDEAHYIRNMRTRQSRACLRLSGVCKWAVTATPVQNSLNDLYPLLRFLEVPHFSVLQWWNDEIVRYYNLDPRHPRPVTALSILFRSILLRRTPDSLVGGKPILDLPPKKVITHTVALSRAETQFYRAIHSKATAKLSELRQREAVTSYSPLATFTTAFEMLVRCRQTCLHPYIVVAALRKCQRLSSSNGTPTDVTAVSAVAGTQGLGGAMRTDALSHANGAAGPASGNPQLNALLQAQREKQQREREAELQTARALDQFIESVVLRRLRTIKASEFVRELVGEIRQQKLEERECIICLDTVNRPAILPCAHVFCEECIRHALEATKKCPLCKRVSKQSELLLVPVELLNPTQHSAAVNAGNAALAGMSNGGTTDAARGTSAHGAKRDGTNGVESVEPPPVVPADLDLTNFANWGLQLSSKTQYLIDTVAGLPREDKVVVFSAFVTYLHYAQHYLEESGITCALYSGSLTMKQKQVLLDRFADAAQPDSPRVLLATTSSCGVGLNLTCANHCFLMDPSWNPGTEEQALNRIHRIGQTKPVTVTKLIADGTIEQNISQLCERKRLLSGYCFGEGGATNSGGGGDGRLRTADLLQLFAPEESSSEESSEDDDDEDEEEDEDES